MTTAHKVLFALIVLVAIGASFATYLVMSERAKVREAQLLSDFQQKKADAAAADMAKREVEWQATQKALQTQLSQIKTQSDVAKALAAPTSKLPALDFNPFEVKPAPQPGDPNAVSVDVPQKNIVPLYKNLMDCSEQHAELGKCQADLGDVAIERDAAKAQAKTWEKAAKGGSVWARLWFASKVAGCGGLGAAAGIATSQANAAAIGGAIGAGFCALALRR